LISCEFSITAQQGTTEIFKGTKTETYGYNGSFLGPIIHIKFTCIKPYTAPASKIKAGIFPIVLASVNVQRFADFYYR